MESEPRKKIYGNSISSRVRKKPKYVPERLSRPLFREWTFNNTSSAKNNARKITLEDAISWNRQKREEKRKQSFCSSNDIACSNSTQTKPIEQDDSGDQRYVYFVISDESAKNFPHNGTKLKRQQQASPVHKPVPADVVSLMRQHTMMMADPISDLDLRMEPLSRGSWFSSPDERAQSGRMSRGPFPTPVSPVIFSKLTGGFEADLSINHGRAVQSPVTEQHHGNRGYPIQRENTSYTLQTIEIPEMSSQDKRKALGSPLNPYRDLLVSPSVGRKRSLRSRGSEGLRRSYTKTHSGFLQSENTETFRSGNAKRKLTRNFSGLKNNPSLNKICTPLSLPKINKVSDYYDELLIETVRSNFESDVGRSEVLIPTAYAPSIGTLGSAKTSRFSTKTARTAPPEITWNSHPSHKFVYDTTYPHQRLISTGNDRKVLKNTYFKMTSPHSEA